MLRLGLPAVWLTALFALSGLSPAAVYYVDAALGNDANSGLSETAAWKTVAKVNGRQFQPGDFILFKRGGVWREQLNIPSSGTLAAPIVFGAYGIGPKPRFSGSNLVTGFQPFAPNALWAPFNYRCQVVYFDNVRGVRRNSLAELAAPYDWYWNNNQLFVYPGDYGAVEASRRDYAIKTNANRQNVVLDGLEAGRADYISVDIFSGVNFTIVNCDIHGSRTSQPNMRVGASVNGLYMQNCTFGRPEDDHYSGRRLLEIGLAGAPGLGGNWIVRHSNFYWTVENDTGPISNDWALGILNARQGGVLIDECVFRNIEDDGIYISGNDTAGAILVQNCYVEGAGNAGIRTWNQKGALGGPIIIRGNLVENCAFAHNDAMGIHVNSTWNPTFIEYNQVRFCRNLDPNAEDGGGIGVDADSHNSTVRYNLIHDNFGKGIYVYGIGGPSSNHLVHHNVVYNNDCGIIVSGNANAPVSNVRVYNNTCYRNYNGPDKGPNYDAEIVVGPNASYVEVKNNILYAPAESPAYYLIQVNLAAIAIDHNVVYREGGGAIGRGSSFGFLSFSQWNTLGRDTQSVNADPLFVSAAARNFQLQSDSPARDIGQFVPLTLDFNGVPLPQGTQFDAGAFEYVVAGSLPPTFTPTPTATPTPTPTTTPAPSLTPTPTPTPVGPVWETLWSVYDQTGAAIGYNSLMNRNYRNWIKGSHVQGSAPVIRLRLRGATVGTGTFIDNASVGRKRASGDPYDFLVPPVPITFDGVPYVLVPPNTTVYSDPVQFSMQAGEDYLVALYLEGSELVALWNQPGVVHAYSRGIAENQTGMENVTGYSEVYSVYMLEAIEGDGLAALTPTPTPIPDTGQPPTWHAPRFVAVAADSGVHWGILELSQYAQDDLTPSHRLLFSRVSESNPEILSVLVHVNGYTTLTVNPGMTGSSRVVFAAQDEAGNISETEIEFRVIGPTGVRQGIWDRLR